jgi:hypothetical protein
VQYWKVISYTKNGKTMQEAWPGDPAVLPEIFV